MFPFVDALFPRSSPAGTRLVSSIIQLVFCHKVVLCSLLFFTLFTHSICRFSRFSHFILCVCACVSSGFSCPFVLFMMINFVAHFLCGRRANKMPIEFAEISTKLSPCIVYCTCDVIPEPIYDDPKSISPHVMLEFPLQPRII